MDPEGEREASRKVGGDRDRRGQRRRRVAAEEVEEPWGNGESDDKNPSVLWRIGGLFLGGLRVEA